MYPTTETRWFTPGPLPEMALRWFEAVAGSPEWERRTDHYLRPAAPDGVNVKWREGNLEIKRPAEVVLTERLHPAADAPLERWRKWSFSLADRAEMEGGDDWIAVAKRRRVQAFRAKNGQIRPAEDEERLEAGCSVEVGEVRLGERAWWTVCFEAFGPSEKERTEQLVRVAKHALEQGDPPTLPTAHAMSYVHWLALEAS